MMRLTAGSKFIALFTSIFGITLGMLLHQPALAAENEEGPKAKLVVLDSDKNTGMTLGLEYDLRTKKQRSNAEIDDPNAPENKNSADAGKKAPRSNKNAVVYDWYYEMRARGTLASTAAKTSNKMLDFTGVFGGGFDTTPAYLSTGIQLGYEMDQDRKNRQATYGLALSATKQLLVPQVEFLNGSMATIQLGYGTVQPGADEARKQLLGTLENYKRWNGELSYTLPIRGKRITRLLFDYRHFQELNAPAMIKNAGSDRHRLWLIQACLPGDFFVQYSRGKLPFDQKDIRAIKVGWSMSLEKKTSDAPGC